MKDLLAKGECTICYARSPAEVKKMCTLCAKETCIGPYNLGDWEDDTPIDYAEVDRMLEQDAQYIAKLKASLGRP